MWEIKNKDGSVYIYWHEGSEIRYDATSTTLAELFGSEGVHALLFPYFPDSFFYSFSLPLSRRLRRQPD